MTGPTDIRVDVCFNDLHFEQNGEKCPIQSPPTASGCYSFGVIKIGWLFFAGLVGCSAPQRMVEDRPVLTDQKRAQIETLEEKGFQLMDILSEDLAIRINVRLDAPLASETETRRRLHNILYQVQSLVGHDDHVAVWGYGSDSSSLQGMVFYSPISESYHFKSPGELR